MKTKTLVDYLEQEEDKVGNVGESDTYWLETKGRRCGLCRGINLGEKTKRQPKE